MRVAHPALAASLALSLLLAGCGAANACACASTSRAKAIASLPIVVKARVVRIVKLGDPNAAGSTTILLRVLLRFKGSTPPEITFSTPAASFACGLSLQSGAVVTLGLGKLDGEYWASACTFID